MRYSVPRSPVLPHRTRTYGVPQLGIISPWKRNIHFSSKAVPLLCCCNFTETFLQLRLLFCHLQVWTSNRNSEEICLLGEWEMGSMQYAKSASRKRETYLCSFHFFFFSTCNYNMQLLVFGFFFSEQCACFKPIVSPQGQTAFLLLLLFPFTWYVLYIQLMGRNSLRDHADKESTFASCLYRYYQKE